MENSAPPPTFFVFLMGLIEPAVLMAWSLKYYIIVVFETIFLRGQILAPILHSRQVRDEAFGRFWVNFSVPPSELQQQQQGATLTPVDTSQLTGTAVFIQPLLQKYLRGVVLDVGPGTGSQMPYFVETENNVSAIYGVEPCAGLHADLRRRADAYGLGEKYHILECGADKTELVDALRRDGVQVDAAINNVKKEKGIFDTIVCIRVLCSVPNPAEAIADLYSLLRPGGQMIIAEHVVNQSSLFGKKNKGGTASSIIFRCAQAVYMFLGWPLLLGDCELTRDTVTYLRNAAERDGGWESFELESKSPWGCLPHVAGVLVKRG